MCWLNDNPGRLRGYRQGDPKVLAEIYKEYALPLASRLSRRFSLQLGGSPGLCAGILGPFDLDDVVQETFIRVFGKSARERFDGSRPFLPYLVVIAKNLILDRARRDGLWRTWLERHPAGAPEADDPTPEAVTLDREFVAEYQRFKGELTERDGKVWSMRFEQELGRNEVAAATGLTVMQLRRLEARMRSRLAKRLVRGGYWLDIGSLPALLLLWASVA